MTANKETKQWWKKIIDVVAQEVGAQLKAQNARIAALEAHVREFKYCGIWQADAVFRRHNSVTQDGSVWICVCEQTLQRPGDGSDWRLAVKRGKDGKDARP